MDELCATAFVRTDSNCGIATKVSASFAVQWEE
jgi:hypothetical protein